MSIYPTKWDTEILYFKGDEYFNSILDSIDHAENEVLIESYIFELDYIGFKFLSRLEVAAKRGVKIQILVDGFGSFYTISGLRQECQNRNLLFKVYHPLPFFNLIKFSWKRIIKLSLILERMNKRNHRKTVLIDYKKAFIGSFNISQKHSEKINGKKVWRDTGLFIEGRAVDLLRRSFLQSWSDVKLENLTDPSTFLKKRVRLSQKHLLRLNSKIRWRFSLLRDLKRRMSNAEKRILITNAYFLPRQGVLRGLRRAARRGIFVGLCIPAKSDVWFVKAAARSLYLRLLKDGVHIFEYQPTVMHAKTLIIDNWGTVGSHNLNHRSLNHDLEVEAVITKTENIELLIFQWNKDVKNSVEVTLKELGEMSLLSRFLSMFAYWFRYWI